MVHTEISGTEQLVKGLPGKIRHLQEVIHDLMNDFIKIKRVEVKKHMVILTALSASIGVFQSTLETYNAYLDKMIQELLHDKSEGL